MRRVLPLAVCLVVIGASIAGAEEPSLEVHLDPGTFGIEDTGLLVVRILEPKGTPDVHLGPIENLEVVGGPSTKTELSWINGAATRSVSLTYIVQGVEVGEAAIGPVTVKFEGLEITADIVRAEIVPGSVVPPRRPGRTSPFPFDPFEDFPHRRQAARSARVVLRQLVDESRVVLGQPVRAMIVLDTTAGGVDGFEWSVPPAYPGWWAQRVEPPERVSGEVVEIEGVRFNRFVVARHVLVPLKTGRLEVPTVEARIGFHLGSLFSPQQVVERATEPKTVEVLQRPRPPAGFSGAVGDLHYTASLEPVTIDFGESAVLTIELQGEGNLPLVEAPAAWPTCGDCESYPPEEESDVTVDDNGIHGRRAWRTTLVPRSSGEIVLEPVMLAVFDPSAGHFRKQTVGPLRLVVNPPPMTPTPVTAEEETKTDHDVATGDSPPVTASGGTDSWPLIVGALILGLALGGAVPILMARKRHVALPPRVAGESPAERARHLQVALERWWMDARTRAKGRALEQEMQQLRRELEAIRFAPGRADHTETVADLEERLRSLMRRG